MSSVVVNVTKVVAKGMDDNRVVGVGSVALALILYYKRKLDQRKRREQPADGPKKGATKNSKKVDTEFLNKFKYVMKEGMPSLVCREAVTATCLTITLVLRTWASLVMAKILGNFLKLFCNRDWPGVRRVLLIFTLFTIPLSGLNALLKFFTQALSSHVREKLTRRVHQLYMQNMNYYKANKVGEKKLTHADQLIAEDIAKFSSQFSSVYSNLLKPLVDFVIFSLQMKSSLGNKGPLTMYFWFAFSAWISSLVMPAYWRLQVKSQELEGTFRSRHKRLIESSEMIAFNGGEIPERKIINDAFDLISSFANYSNIRQFISNSCMGYLNKYSATSVGMTLICLPIFLSKKYAHYTASEIASFYLQSSRIMGGQAEAVLALFELQKEIGQLAGLTLRVWDLIHCLESPEKLNLPTELDNPPEKITSDTLSFKNVSIYKPDGTLLVKHLNFSVPKGSRVMITGENGCGKSSLFRVLRGLWPLSVGTIESPPRNSLKTFYFLSQANFVPIGSLREILIYPHQITDMRAEGKTDQDLLTILEWCQIELKLGDLPLKLDTVLDWNTLMAPGVKQRLAFARLLYHRPLYAILDECTNNMASQIETLLYEKCRELGITVFSISHNLDLKKSHDYELHYDGKGGYSWIVLQENKRHEI